MLRGPHPQPFPRDFPMGICANVARGETAVPKKPSIVAGLGQPRFGRFRLCTIHRPQYAPTGLAGQFVLRSFCVQVGTTTLSGDRSNVNQAVRENARGSSSLSLLVLEEELDLGNERGEELSRTLRLGSLERLSELAESGDRLVDLGAVSLVWSACWEPSLRTHPLRSSPGRSRWNGCPACSFLAPARRSVRHKMQWRRASTWPICSAELPATLSPSSRPSRYRPPQA